MYVLNPMYKVISFISPASGFFISQPKHPNKEYLQRTDVFMFSEQSAGGCDIELGSTHHTSHLQFPASDFKSLTRGYLCCVVYETQVMP